MCNPRALLYLLGEPGLVLHNVQRGVLDDHVLHTEPRHDLLGNAPTSRLYQGQASCFKSLHLSA